MHQHNFQYGRCYCGAHPPVKRLTPRHTSTPPAPTLDSITSEHAERLGRAYTLRTFGDNSETGTLTAYLLALESAGLVTIKR